MRLILPVGCILVLTVLVCGCIQSHAAPPVTPAETSGVTVLVPTDTTIPPHPRMAVNITVGETANSVIILVAGGNDTAALSSINVRITNLDGTTVQRVIHSPVVGRPYSIQYYRYANAANVNIVGTFSDGFQQTLLMTSV